MLAIIRLPVGFRSGALPGTRLMTSLRKRLETGVYFRAKNFTGQLGISNCEYYDSGNITTCEAKT